MRGMFKGQNYHPSRWFKLLQLLPRVVARMRSQASARAAIAKAERAVRRKIKAARDAGC